MIKFLTPADMLKRTKIKIPEKKRQFLFFYLPLIFLMALLNTNCIEEYDPNLNVDVDLLTVNGSIVRGQEEQTVVITRSTPVDDTQYKAVENCNVFVSDDRNNKFQFTEISAGKYVAKIDMAYLDIGAKFKLTINTPDNNIYESDYEEIKDCPPIDNLYFLEEINYSTELHRNLNGLRLNLDLQAYQDHTEYYRWKINETWEYRSRNTWIDRELVGAEANSRGEMVPVFHYFYRLDSLHYCWHNAKVNELFSASTLNIVTNGRKRVPLHYIFGNNERLIVKYSCLVSQYSLNEGAYNYWQNKEVEIKESGGMYFSQPGQTVSNIKNIYNEDETVLGYFWTSSLKQKRIFFEGPPFKSDYTNPCKMDTFDVQNFFKGSAYTGEYYMINSAAFPVYVVDIVSDEGRLVPMTGDNSCFDCRLKGGTIIRPDYW